jgi:hypothetical protein
MHLFRELRDLGLRRSDPGPAQVTVVAVRERMVQRAPTDPVAGLQDHDGVTLLLDPSRGTQSCQSGTHHHNIHVAVAFRRRRCGGG